MMGVTQGTLTIRKTERCKTCDGKGYIYLDKDNQNMNDDNDVSEIIPSVADLIGRDSAEFEQALRSALEVIAELLRDNTDILKKGGMVQWNAPPGTNRDFVKAIVDVLVDKGYGVEMPHAIDSEGNIQDVRLNIVIGV